MARNRSRGLPTILLCPEGLLLVLQSHVMREDFRLIRQFQSFALEVI